MNSQDCGIHNEHFAGGTPDDELTPAELERLRVVRLACALAKLEAANDLLSDVWNLSLVQEDRDAIGQDGMEPMMRQLNEQIKRLSRSLRR